MGNEAGITFLFVVMIAAKDTGGAFSQGVLPFANLAGVDFKAIGQLGDRLFTL